MTRFGHNYLVHCTFRTVFGASTATKLAHLHQPMAWNVQFWHSASRLGLHHSLQTGFVCTTWSTWASSCTKISKSAHKMLTIATVNSLIDHQRTTDTPCLQELGQISKVRARNLQLAITQPASRPERQKRKFTKGRTRTQTKTMCDGNGQLLYHMANQPAHVRPHIELLYVLQKKKKKKKKKKKSLLAGRLCARVELRRPPILTLCLSRSQNCTATNFITQCTCWHGFDGDLKNFAFFEILGVLPP